MTSGGRHQNSPPRIMVVDDESDILVILRSGLETNGGFVVDSFTNGEDAYQGMQAKPPTIMISS